MFCAFVPCGVTERPSPNLWWFMCFQGMHPAFIGAQYPFSVATSPQQPLAATAVTFPGVPVPSMTQIAVHPYHTETGLPLTTTVAGQNRSLVSCRLQTVQSQICLCCCAVGSVHSGPSIQAIQAASLPAVAPQPSFVSASFPAEDEQHSQPISQQGFHYLHSAYRVGEESHLLS